MTLKLHHVNFATSKGTDTMPLNGIVSSPEFLGRATARLLRLQSHKSNQPYHLTFTKGIVKNFKR